MKAMLLSITIMALLATVLLTLTLSAPDYLRVQPEPQQPAAWRTIEEEAVPLVDAVPEPDSAARSTSTRYPVGKLLLSDRRKAYVGGTMLLEIPRLNLTCPVLNGTDEDTMKKGACLFEYAQLPGVSNANTSITAHRDIYGQEFYNIHKMTDGDRMYLTYEGKKYTYEYMETFITDSSDWEPIKSKDFACITLQSCDPIGLAFNRIFVTGKLVDIEDSNRPDNTDS